MDKQCRKLLSSVNASEYCVHVTHNEWPKRLANTIAKEVQRVRAARGMSAQDLSNACTALGLPFSRSAIANFESGRRPNLSVAELLVLARALRVPPALLVFPLGINEESELPPGEVVDTWDAVQWLGGDYVESVSGEDAITIVADYREHDELVRRWRKTQDQLDRLRVSGGDEELAATHEHLISVMRSALIAMRRRMQVNGYKPPRLPADLAAVVDMEG